MKVLDFAMKMEADGKAYYEKLATDSDDKELKNLFTLLAQAEQTHYDALLARKEEVAFAMVESNVLDQAKNIFQRLLEMKSHGPFRVDTDGYRHAIKAEEQSIGYYQDSAEKEQNPEVRRLLQTLADEEKIHLNIVENIYEFVESPKFFLAWREFSNLKEL
ncbi:MAG: ferritin [Geobacteraceae bacterium GWC2_58_44]|nr:MAG: ferritin [Geobacteraceae bacterium GWC2_58_44]